MITIDKSESCADKIVIIIITGIYDGNYCEEIGNNSLKSSVMYEIFNALGQRDVTYLFYEHL